MTDKIRRLCFAAMFAALCYVGFQFLRIDIPVGAGKTAVHLGNAFCVLAALYLGGLYGGAAGAIGMGIADITGGYITSAPMTVLLKFLMGIIAHLSYTLFKKKFSDFTSAVAASISAGLANLVLDPVSRYLYNLLVYSKNQDIAALLAKISSVSTAVNAVITVIIILILYKPLKKIILF